LGKPVKVYDDEDCRYNPKQGKKKFPFFSGEFQSERHAVILSKMDDKPITQHLIFLSEGHVGFDPEFGNLIGKQDENNKNSRFFQQERSY